MLVDFKDTGLECPPAVVTAWLPQPSTNLLLRVVVPMIESWLLADREGLAAFLGVSPALLPTMPETLINPKQALVNLAGNLCVQRWRQPRARLRSSGQNM